MKNRIHVGVIFGGQSCEHEVSVSSAWSIMESIDTEKFDITLIKITKSGQWISSADAHHLLQSDTLQGEFAVQVDHCSARKLIFRNDTGDIEKDIDVLFPILHGPYGEDGTVQGLLELSGIPYVGSDVVGSAVSMDKEMMRRAFYSEGLRQVEYLVVDRRKWENRQEETKREIQSRLTYPLFIKPISLGSSVGIVKVHSAEELEHGMNEAASFDHKVMIEQAAPNCREIEAAVIGNGSPQAASAIGEVVPCNEFYDYAAKYQDDATELIIPARISLKTADEVRKMALQAFKAVKALGLSRVDFFVNKDDESIFINEINTMPGFTPTSMYPKLWAASGVPYSELIDRLIQMSIERHHDRQNVRVVL